MRQLNHVLLKSSSGKSVTLKVMINDRYGKQEVIFATLHGWRMNLAEKRLSVRSNNWDDVARVFVSMKVLSYANDEYDGIRFLNCVKEHNVGEVFFWASKFLSNSETGKAWRTLYGRSN